MGLETLFSPSDPLRVGKNYGGLHGLLDKDKHPCHHNLLVVVLFPSCHKRALELRPCHLGAGAMKKWLVRYCLWCFYPRSHWNKMAQVDKEMNGEKVVGNASKKSRTISNDKNLSYSLKYHHIRSPYFSVTLL